MTTIKSTFKNWRKHETNSKKQELSTSFPVRVSGNAKALTVEFQNEEGKRITFNLNEHDAALMVMHIDKHYHGKDVKREDYNLEHV